MVNVLLQPVTSEEVQSVLSCMAPLKAPGPDGVPASFYQEDWDVVGPSLFRLVSDAFTMGSFPQALNKSFISLVPKKSNPETVHMIRPITLSNVSYKILTKLLTHRLRPMLGELIGPFQSSFLPGRSTADNILLVQEVVHSMRRKKGRKGHMLLKVEKAYDKLSWKFIESTLEEFAFPHTIVSLIMSCLRSASTSVIWNGSLCDSFRPSRGVRQGCPLSPYIFVLCMERLAGLIEARVHEGTCFPLRVSRRGLPLSYLFYADDFILMGEASRHQMDVMMDCLRIFSEDSGEVVNYEKSRFFFSNNLS